MRPRTYWLTALIASAVLAGQCADVAHRPPPAPQPAATVAAAVAGSGEGGCGR